MKQIFLLFATLCTSALLTAQTPGTDTLRRRFEVGLNITNTLGSFVGSTGGITNDPYLLSFRFGGPDRRLRAGVNFKIQDKTDPDVFDVFKEKSTLFQVRTGFEWVAPVARRLALYYGLDAVFERETDEIVTFSNGGGAALRSDHWGVGGGPVLGIAWRVHPRVALTTECAMYVLVRRGHEQVNAPPDFSDRSFREFVWQPLLPTSLFVNFAF